MMIDKRKEAKIVELNINNIIEIQKEYGRNIDKKGII